MTYIKGKGILITNTEYVKKSGKIVGMKTYVCSMEDFKI